MALFKENKRRLNPLFTLCETNSLQFMKLKLLLFLDRAWWRSTNLSGLKALEWPPIAEFVKSWGCVLFYIHTEEDRFKKQWQCNIFCSLYNEVKVFYLCFNRWHFFKKAMWRICNYSIYPNQTPRSSWVQHWFECLNESFTF